MLFSFFSNFSSSTNLETNKNMNYIELEKTMKLTKGYKLLSQITTENFILQK